MLSQEEKDCIKKIAENSDMLPEREAYRLAGYGAAMADMKEKQEQAGEDQDGRQAVE